MHRKWIVLTINAIRKFYVKAVHLQYHGCISLSEAKIKKVIYSTCCALIMTAIGDINCYNLP